MVRNAASACRRGGWIIEGAKGEMIMPKRITPGQIKKNNRQQIYKYIYQHRKVSQQDIAYALRLSRPTVTTNLNELEDDGLIYKSGHIQSDQIGRKATAYSIIPDYRIAIGVEILRSMIKIVAVDLYGKKIRREVLDFRYANELAYYEQICRSINAFIYSLDFPREQILGIGLAMQALASNDGRSISYGAILGCTGLRIEVFEKWLDYPCRFIHDPAAAALSELWVSPELNDAVYLSMSPHLGGALISNRRIITGKHGHNATFEHIQAEPGGKLCYCGKRGCWDTLLSIRALVGDKDREDFFIAVREGDEAACARWNGYLLNLARLIGSLHLINDVDFILGGHLAQFFTEEDIQVLYDGIRTLCPFEEEEDFIHISKMPSHNITIGVALSYIQDFLDDVGPETE